MVHILDYIIFFLIFLAINTLLTGWCGEVRDVIFSDNGSVTVVYRVTIRGSDGEVWFISLVIYIFSIRRDKYKIHPCGLFKNQISL